MMYIVENGNKMVAKAYATAGGAATESLFSMRTVASLGIEQAFIGRYKQALSSVRRVKVRNDAVIMCTGGMALSAYLFMMAAAILYGAFMLAREIERSSFDFIVNDPASGSDVHYCADAAGQLLNLSATSCLLPLQMTCQLGSAIDKTADTPLARIAERTGLEVPGGYDNSTLLSLYSFSSVSDFASFVQSHSPAEYADDNPSYYECKYGSSKIIIAIFAIMMMGEGFSMSGQPAAKLSEARQAAVQVLEIIGRVPTIDSFSDQGTQMSDVKGQIEVRDVVFSYPSAPEMAVCRGYSLDIPAGQTVALCGPSGSGKSTIIQLLERFYDPQEGTVLLDGVDIKTLNVRWLRSQIGYVGQEPVLFSGSVADNIAHGRPGATQEEIEEAATMANAHGFIKDNLADGYRTDVGLKGGKLSGGQKQRVAIARAIIKKPAVLLLDEATSALDNESERIVQAALDEIMAKQKRTTVVIAHRLSTIRGADKIAVVSEGKVLEQGTHDELLANQNLYCNLVMAAA